MNRAPAQRRALALGGAASFLGVALAAAALSGPCAVTMARERDAAEEAAGAPGESGSQAPERREQGAAAGGEESDLVAGVPLERELAGGEMHAFRLRVSAGQYFRVVVEQREVDVVLSLRRPDGEALLQADRPTEGSGREVLEWVSEAEGEVRVEVAALSQGDPKGRCRIVVEELRDASAQDRSDAALRNQSRRLLAEALDVAMHASREDLAAAVARAREAEDLAARGRDPGGEAWALDVQGSLLQRLEETAEAERVLQGALARWQAAGDWAGEATTLGHLADLLTDRQAFGEAEAAYLRSLAIWEREGNRPLQASLLSSLGLLRFRQGDTHGAARYFHDALELSRLTGYATGERDNLYNLGVVASAQGRAEEALGWYRNAATVLARVPDAALEAKVLAGEAAALLRLGRLQDAMERCLRAKPVARQAGDLQTEATLLHTLASALVGLGDRDRALKRYVEALALFRSLALRDLEGRTLRNLGWLEYESGNLQAALGRFEEALAVSAAALDRPTEMRALYGRGVVQRERGLVDEALADLQCALRIAQEMGDRATAARVLSEIGAALDRSGSQEAARQALEHALGASRELGDVLLEAATLSRLGRLARGQRQWVEARVRIEAALRIYDSLRTEVTSPELRATFFASRRSHWESYVDLLLRLEAAEPGQGGLAEALHASEGARARSLLELLAEARVEVHRGISPTFKEREAALARQVSAVQSEMLHVAAGQDPPPAALAEARTRLSRLRDEQEQLEVEIRRSHPRYASVAYPEPLSLHDTQALLGPKDAFLEYLLGEEVAVLLVVTKDGVASYRLEATAEEIATLTLDLRRAFTARTREGDRAFPNRARRLYQLLVEPVAPLLAGIDHLVIAPDASLYYLPFEALVMDAPAGDQPAFASLPYLITRYRVSYVPSATVLANLGSGKAPAAGADRRAFVGFADPVYPGGTPAAAQASAAAPEPLRGTLAQGGPLQLPRLAASAREVASIAALFDPRQAVIFLQKEASEGTVKNHPLVAGAERLHFATHGLIDEDEPANTGLALTGGEPSGEDGLLQIGEIFDLDLSADLVVLSACSSGLGKRLTGEGLVGLSQAFMYAGAPSLVVTLWRVEDESAAELMVSFYRSIPASRDKSEALRRAKLAMIEAGGSSAHPANWAAFILVGRS